MNIWLSSGANHQWNPGQKAPATAWEAEIDQLMRKQASTVVFDSRKAAFNRVQEIVADQVPFIYLISKNSLIAVTPRLKGIRPSALRPQLYWNAEFLHLGD
jgi:peptide/nickel transport system substrate-binding protein